MQPRGGVCVWCAHEIESVSEISPDYYAAGQEATLAYACRVGLLLLLLSL